MSLYIPFRLRQHKDDDIKKGINEELDRAAQLEQEIDRSDVIRAALRFYFRHKNSLPSGVDHDAGESATPSSREVISCPVRENERHTETQRSPLINNTGKPFLGITHKKKTVRDNPPPPR